MKINKSNFSNSPITIGDGNKITIKNSDKSINWELLQDELIKASSKLPESSKEHASVKEALKYSMLKDKRGLIQFLKKHCSDFTSDLFKGVASDTLSKIIDSIKSMVP